MFNLICTCIAFLAVETYFLTSQGSRLIYHNDGSLPDELDTMELYLADPAPSKRSDKSKIAATSGLWFGPRLGRRKRTNNENGIGEELTLAQEQALIGALQEGPWTMLSLKGGKRRSVNFTPRLGRDSDENLMENFVDPGLSDYGRVPLRSGAQNTGNNAGGSNFTPRLGRLAPPSNEQQLQH